MNKRVFLLLLILCLSTSIVLVKDNIPKSTTLINVHIIGPNKIGPLPAVPVPVDNPQTAQKILLGKQLYFDTRLSIDNSESCASCHDPAMGWSDKGPTSKGVKSQVGPRRAPPVSNAAYFPLQFWDGRAETLEDQAIGPIANPKEMGNTHENMLKTLNSVPGYVEEFKLVFGKTPITVSQVALAIAAFERTVVTTDSLFDRYVKGDTQGSLSPLEQKGLEIFNGKGHCTACHWGANFSDGRFHNIGEKNKPPMEEDEGRYKVTKDKNDMRAFKTPTVRDASLRAPYMHNGQQKTLQDVVDLYNEGGGHDDSDMDPLMVPLGLSNGEIEALIAFMKVGLKSLNEEAADVKPIPQSELPK